MTTPKFQNGDAVLESCNGKYVGKRSITQVLKTCVETDNGSLFDLEGRAIPEPTQYSSYIITMKEADSHLQVLHYSMVGTEQALAATVNEYILEPTLDRLQQIGTYTSRLLRDHGDAEQLREILK